MMMTLADHNPPKFLYKLFYISVMKYYVLCRTSYNSNRFDKIISLCSEEILLRGKGILRKISENELNSSLEDYLYKENNLIKCRLDDKSYILINKDGVCIFFEEDDKNYLRTLLYRLKGIHFIEVDSHMLNLLLSN